MSNARCCHVHYKVTETRGSGDDQTTVTIEEWTAQVPFECHDEEGAIRVVPDGAEVQARLAVHRSAGRRNYYEYHIAEGEELYILGSAVIEPVVGETLQMADGDNDGFPFLISDQNERETMLKVSRGGLMRMSFGFIGIVMTVLLLFAGTGSYSPSDFLVAALTAPAFLVFLSRRVEHSVDLQNHWEGHRYFGKRHPPTVSSYLYFQNGQVQIGRT